MPTKSESPVARHIAGLPPRTGRIASRVRRIVLGAAPGITEQLKWGMPWFSKGQGICYLKANRQHVTFGFAKGASLTDPDRLLEGSGKSMRHVKLRTPADVRPRRFAQWVRHAIRLNRGPVRAT